MLAQKQDDAISATPEKTICLNKEIQTAAQQSTARIAIKVVKFRADNSIVTALLI